MAQNSKIEWTHHTANLWWGCAKVHAGCDNCYAENLDKRWGGNHWGAKAPRRMIKRTFDELLNYQRKAATAGEVHRVFVGSMMDIFEKPMPIIDSKGQPIVSLNANRKPMDTGDLRDLLFKGISHELYPNLLFLLLTKRPGNIMKYIPEEWKTNPPSNVMYGTSPVNQETADDMIPKLLEVPGKHFLSCEPLLAELDLAKFLLGDCECMRYEYDRNGIKTGATFTNADCLKHDAHGVQRKIDWVIVGGESGHNARPMHPDWPRFLRDQCDAAGVPFFFKQHGEWLRCKDARDLGINYATVYNFEDGVGVAKVGKKAAGRQLYGKEYSQFPEIKMEVANG